MDRLVNQPPAPDFDKATIDAMANAVDAIRIALALFCKPAKKKSSAKVNPAGAKLAIPYAAHYTQAQALIGQFQQAAGGRVDATAYNLQAFINKAVGYQGSASTTDYQERARRKMLAELAIALDAYIAEGAGQVADFKPYADRVMQWQSDVRTSLGTYGS